MKRNKKIILVIIILLILSFTSSCTNNKKEKKETDNTINERIVEDAKTLLVKFNTKGQGQLSYYISDEKKVDFSDLYPVQSSFVKVESNTKIIIDAKAYEGWKFVNWTKNGKDFSKKSKEEVVITEPTDFVAIFEEETNEKETETEKSKTTTNDKKGKK